MRTYAYFNKYLLGIICNNVEMGIREAIKMPIY